MPISSLLGFALKWVRAYKKRKQIDLVHYLGKAQDLVKIATNGQGNLLANSVLVHYNEWMIVYISNQLK